MMHPHFKWENLLKERAYPLRYKNKNLAKTAGIQFGVLFMFLVLYKPFGVYEPELKFNYFLVSALHALSPSLIVFIYFWLLNYYRSKFSYLREWTLLQEYVQLSFVLLLVGIASFLMRGLLYNNPYNWSFRYLFEEIRNCYLIGSLFYFYLLFANFYFKAKVKPAHVLRVPPGIHRAKEPDITELFITTRVKQDDFSFNPGELLFVRAEGNYLEVTLCRNGQLTTELKRISLRQFEAKINDYPFLFRCHRAYLVNMLQIKNVSGNSQGYLLSFEGPADKIPVSRALLSKFGHLYEQLHNYKCN